MRLVHRHRFGRHPDLAWGAPEVLGGVGVHARFSGLRSLRMSHLGEGNGDTVTWEYNH
jgi:hypothetical protein